MTKPPTTTAIQTVAVMNKLVARPRPIRRSSNRWVSQLGKIAEPSRSQLHPGITRNAIACSRDMGEIQIAPDGHVTRLSIAATVIIPAPAIAMIRSSTPAARDLNRHSRRDARALDHTTHIIAYQAAAAFCTRPGSAVLDRVATTRERANRRYRSRGCGHSQKSPGR